MRILILNYMNLHYCDTYKKIIYRYAPPNENNTVAYLKYVCDVCDAKPNDKVDNLYKLIRAICWYESNYLLTWKMWMQAYNV